MDWFRSWHGAPTDNKWLLIAKRAGVTIESGQGTSWFDELFGVNEEEDKGD